jgi:hypothetical protein
MIERAVWDLNDNAVLLVVLSRSSSFYMRHSTSPVTMPTQAALSAKPIGRAVSLWNWLLSIYKFCVSYHLQNICR